MSTPPAAVAPRQRCPRPAPPHAARSWQGGPLQEPRVFLLFWIGQRSPELFDLLLRFLGRRREEPSVCLLFWCGRYAPWLFDLILSFRRWSDSASRYLRATASVRSPR
jgi:hypothetical protein